MFITSKKMDRIGFYVYPAGKTISRMASQIVQVSGLGVINIQIVTAIGEKYAACIHCRE